MGVIRFFLPAMFPEFPEYPDVSFFYFVLFLLALQEVGSFCSAGICSLGIQFIALLFIYLLNETYSNFIGFLHLKPGICPGI